MLFLFVFFPESSKFLIFLKNPDPFLHNKLCSSSLENKTSTNFCFQTQIFDSLQQNFLFLKRKQNRSFLQDQILLHKSLQTFVFSKLSFKTQNSLIFKGFPILLERDKKITPIGYFQFSLLGLKLKNLNPIL
ncbi:MAG: hypothetical protein DRP09_15565 [Candidatus Thorarchaeota archaeon]|nr:MAG: hypothetical protein DRP09_15565 [Candidatus Thorarchaeota archaeon]